MNEVTNNLATIESSGMNISTEEVEYCKVRANYTADAEVVKKSYQAAIKQLRKMPVPGFRPGKATDLAIKLKYKDRITEWVKQEMLNQANDDILFETKMQSLGTPTVESSKLSNSDFKCQLLYLKKPEFELKQYNGLEIPAPHMEKSVEEVAEFFIQDLRKRHGEVRPYDESDSVWEGDQVTLTYELTKLGKKEEGQLYIVGSNGLPGLDDNLLGMIPGESRKFITRFEDKETECEVTVHMGMKNILCPPDDALAQKCGLKDLDELVSTARVVAHKQHTNIRNGKIAEQIKIRLVADHDFDPPEWLINMEAQHLALQEGFKWEELDDDTKGKYLNRGKDNSKFTLIIDSIKRDEPEVDIANTEAIEGIKRAVIDRGIPNVDQWLQQSLKNGTLHGLVAKFKNDYTLQWLVEHAKVVE